MKRGLKVFLLVLIFAMCGVLSACRDRYRDLGFDIYYAYTSGENANWQKVENGNLSLLYGDSAGSIPLTEEGNTLNGTIYLRVEVTGVGEKYIDRVLIQNIGSGTNAGLNMFSQSSMVENNGILPLSISLNKTDEGEYVSTTLKFTETTSNKSSNITFNLNPSLNEMQMSTEQTVAVAVGGYMQLSSNLINFIPQNTSQKGVTYTFDSVGYYRTDYSTDGTQETRTFVPQSTTNSDVTVSESGLVSVNSTYVVSETNYIVRVRATSTQNPSISTTIDVFVVPANTQGTQANVSYANGNQMSEDNVTLYVGSSQFSSASFDVELFSSTANVYFGSNALTSVVGQNIYYQLNVYIDGEFYDLDSNNSFHGLRVELIDGSYKVTATETTYSTVALEFRYELVGASYNGELNINYSRTISVIKEVLPSGIYTTVSYSNNSSYSEALTNGEEIDADIYSTNNLVYLSFSALQNNVTNIEQCLFNINQTGNALNISASSIYHGQTMTVSFANTNSATTGRIQVSLPCTPAIFEGEEIPTEVITIYVNFTFVVTANKVEAYANNTGTISVTDDSLNGAFNVAQNQSANIYFRVYHTNSNLDRTSIKVESNNPNIAFDASGATSITFDRLNYSYIIAEGYTLFTLPVYVGQTDEEATLTITIADGNISLGNDSNTSIRVRSVFLASADSLSVKIDGNSSSNAEIELTNQVENGHQNFAVTNGAEHSFRVFDESNSSQAISDITVRTNNTYSSISGFSTGALTNIIPSGTSENNYFSFTASLNLTQVLDITVRYYALDTTSGVITLQSRILTCEFAVFTPVSSVRTSVTNQTIGYLNNTSTNSTATIDYSALNSNSVTRTITFSGVGTGGEIIGQTIDNVSAIKPAYIEGGRTYILDDSTTNLIRGLTIESTTVDNYQGSLDISLIEEVSTLGLSGIRITFIVYRFGTEVSSAVSEYISFENYDLADRVVAVGGDIDASIVNTKYLYLTDREGENQAQFEAYAEWDSVTDSLRLAELDYQLYQYSQNADGTFVQENGQFVLTPYNLSGLSVLIKEGTVTVLANQNLGGVFKLVVGSIDSCTEDNGVKTFATSDEVILSVSNGSLSNPYLIKDQDDLLALDNSGSDKYYALANDIVVDMSTSYNGNYLLTPIQGFNGKLTGRRQFIANNQIVEGNYRITLNLNLANSVEIENNSYSGLFATLGEDASIYNLSINATITGQVSAQNSYIGIIAGQNLGNISGVDLTISGSASLNGDETVFGSYVGENAGNISLEEGSLVQTALTINVYNGTVSIGGIAGTNLGAGRILGGYIGKTSLNNVEYSVIVNSVINNFISSEGSFGGIVGESEGDISNLIVGGQIIVQDMIGVSSSAYVGGVAGKSTANSISDIALLGLNLTAETNTNYVAGVVAQSQNTTISNTKTIFASVTFSNIGITTGQISGQNVSGVVADATNVGISYTTVESFIALSENFNALVGENVAGISLDAVTISNSFVYANISGENRVVLLGSGTNTNSYYIGRVNNWQASADINQAILVSGANTNVYQILPLQNGYYSAIDQAFVSLEGEDATIDLSTILPSVFPNGNLSSSYYNIWAINENYNLIQVGEKTFALPYLLQNGEPLLIIAPTDINIAIDQEYVEEISSTYVGDNFNFDWENVEIVETVIVNYFSANSNPNSSVNIHNLVSENDDGLFGLEILPTDSTDITGGVAFEIVPGYGSQYATIVNSNQIMFTGVSGKQPIIIRCYSIFNSGLSKYAVVFTQYGASQLVVEGDNVYSNSNGYALDIIAFNDSEKTSTTVNISTINYYLGGAYNSIVENGGDVLDYLHLGFSEVEGLSISSNGLALTIAVEDANLIEDYASIDLSLYLDAYNYFGSDHYDENTTIEITSVELRVNVFPSAESITLQQSELSGSTSATFVVEAGLQTSYVDSELPDNYFETLSGYTSGNYFILDSSHDGFNIEFSYDESAQNEINNLLLRAGVESIAELFGFEVSSTYILGYGYRYNITFYLIDDFDYRYIENEINLTLKFYAKSNEEVSSELKLNLIPTPLAGVQLENYSASRIEAVNNYQTIVSGSAETSVIEPGGLGGVMVVRLQPSYSDVTSAQITSGSLFVPTLGRNVFIHFEQLVYDPSSGNYLTLSSSTPVYDNAGNLIGIQLQKVSQIVNGNFTYNGIIYVHSYIDSFAGLESQIEVTLSVNTQSSSEPITRTKTLTTKYVPGAYLSYSGIQASDGYLIQTNSANNTATIRLVGYQFNSNPTITYEWVKYVEQNGVWTWVAVDADEYATQPSQYISTTFNYNNLTTDANGSYYLPMTISVGNDLPYAFRINVHLSLNSSTDSTNQTQSIVFIPTDYILTTVAVSNLTSNTLNVALNENRTVDLALSTQSANDYVNILNELLYSTLAEADEENFIDIFSINGNALSLYSDYFSYSINNNLLTILGRRTLNRTTVSVSINYAYEPVYSVDTIIGYKLAFKFGDGSHNLSTSFILNIYDRTSEDAPRAIYTAEEFIAMNEGENYILMNDITLTDYTPISAAIASLDGNNRVINIESFATSTTQTNYGLFASLGTYQDIDENTQRSILKNVIVSYGTVGGNGFSLSLLNNNITSVVFGGLVAQNAGGIIYNCEVMNLSNQEFNLYVDDSSSVTVTFGGLVGINSGVITNSRVGRMSYTRVTVSDRGATLPTQTIYAGAITFNIGNANQQDSNSFKAVAGGFVGENSGTIASSFVANTTLVNYSYQSASQTGSNPSRTAGFVAENTGTISYSYVKALESTISTTQAYSSGASISNKGNGTVAGFVHLNNGSIDNSFANTQVESESNFVAGFVYENASGASISECYSACTLNSGLANSSAEQPFVGVDATDTVLSNGTLTNVYYYDPNSNLTQTETTLPQAVALNTDNIQDSSNLHGFVFIESSSVTERDQGVWSYYMVGGYEKHILPEINNANSIAISYRYLLEDGENYANATGYAQGSSVNPYIIRDADEFNDVFTTSGTSSAFTGYVRLIDNIDLTNANNVTKSVILGENGNSTTSFEGNGMTISGIFLDVTSPNVQKVGLFAEINNAYIKNVTLQFRTDQYSTLRATYSGGLAGTISDSVISNITLDGAGATIIGNNFAGGLAGLISGSSLISNINSNLNVRVNSTDVSVYNLYYNETDYANMQYRGYHNESYSNYLTTLSYAGGIAGVLDITGRTGSNYNLSYINIYGNEMQASTTFGTDQANILADFAGGVAGYAGNDVKAFRIKYFVGDNEYISGRYASGGLFGAFLGSVTASQVTAEEEIQLDYDAIISEYIIALENGEEDAELRIDEIGNTNLVRSTNNAGGLIGLGINASVNSCYSRAGITGGVIGGLIALSVSSSVLYSYAVPIVNLTEDWSYAGGLIGRAYGSGTSYVSTGTIAEYSIYVDLKSETSSKGTTIQNSFSTIILDVNDPDNISNLDSAKVLDYIVADCMHGAGGDKSVQDPIISMYAGTMGANAYDAKGFVFSENLTSYRSTKSLVQLYDLQHNEHTTAYDDIFSSWNNNYWALDNSLYFPLLTEDEALNYIPIYDQDDFELIKSNPDANYMVMNDINMAGYSDGNYILDIEFTGRLVGNTEDTDSIPQLFNLTISTEFDDEGSGFFRATTGAEITNLEFVYATESASGITVNNDITYFGGVSSSDNGSTFTNLLVYKNSGSRGSFLTTNDLGTIQGFGGVVGSAVNSIVYNCTFAGDVVATVVAEDVGSANIGGLIGRGEKNDTYTGSVSEGEATAVNFNLSGCTIGYSGITTSFNLEIASVSGTVNIGGLIGHVSGGSINTCTIGQVSSRTRFNISAGSINTINFGGIAGYGRNTNISTCSARTNNEFSGGQTSTNARLGGFAGVISNSDTTYTVQGIEVNTDFNLYQLNANELAVSTGVALVENSATIYRSAFLGDINNETAPIGSATKGSVQSIIAGGVIAYATSGVYSLGELATEADFILGGGSAQTADMGGAIGKVGTDHSIGGVQVDLNNSVISGRLVPYGFTAIATDSENNAQEFNIGGLLGGAYADAGRGTFDFEQIICLTSILLDGMANETIQYLSNVSALFGRIPEDSTENYYNIFYSTDYAMFTEGKDDGEGSLYNLSAYTLTYAGGNGTAVNSWKYSFTQGDARLIWTVGDNKLPYPTALQSMLTNLGIISSIDNASYVEGSAFRPITLSATSTETIDLDSATSYTYYVINMATGSTSNCNLKFKGQLNGMIFGSNESIYNAGTQAENGYVEDLDTYYGFIPSIGTHSAVSNLHLIYTNPISTYNATNGAITGLNNGVISNCSVMGNNLSIDTNSSVSLGLIAGNNKGFINYCYSSAEIVDTGDLTQISGIVYLNSGKLLSNYFTGYINNVEDCTAAGIANTLLNGEGYLYNNYMAGVIVNVSGNSFVNSSDPFSGSNNYIDKNANNEIVSILSTESTEENTVIALQTVESEYLFTNLNIDSETLLQGNLYVLGNENVQESQLFGYNYGYPINRLNRRADSMLVDDMHYSLYTGDGGYETTGLAENENAILHEGSEYYNNAFKIPHFGVFKILNYLYAGTDPTPLNFVVIYDLDGSPAVEGTSATNISWGSIDNFTGVFVSNRYFAYNPIENEDEDYYRCTISNFQGQSLFTNIMDATFAYINFGGTIRLNTSYSNPVTGAMSETISGGILGNIVGSSSSSAEQTETNVNQIKFDLENDTFVNYSVSSSVAGQYYFGALFGQINRMATVNITNLRTPNDEDNFSRVVLCSLDNSQSIYMGLISGANTGTITLDESQMFVRFRSTASVNAVVAGGLVGVNSGTIRGTSIEARKTYIESQMTTAEALNIVGGIVGTTNSSAAQVSDINTSFDDEFYISSTHIGGLTGTSIGGVFTNCDITNDIIVYSNAYFGLLSSYNHEGGELVVSDISLKTEGTLTITTEAPVSDEAIVSGGIGGLVGHLESGTIKFSPDAEISISIGSVGVENIGGIVGRYDGGKVLISTSQTYDVYSLTGTKNVGGAFGLVTTDIFSDEACTPYEGDSFGAWNFLNAETGTPSYATIRVGAGNENIGGLIGSFEGVSIYNLTNKNTIMYSVKNAGFMLIETTEEDVAKNIGGVVGNITQKLASAGQTNAVYNLSNEGLVGSIPILANTGSSDASYVGTSGIYAFVTNSDQNLDVLTQNVGGVIGKFSAPTSVSDSTDDEATSTIGSIENPSNGYVIGYQNVGGIIGYLDASTGSILFNSRYVPEEDDTTLMPIETVSQSSVIGAINVGGIIGLAYANNGIDIQGLTLGASASVYGNANVGGLVGYNYQANLVDNSVQAHEVKGLVYQAQSIVVNSADADTIENPATNYIPTNVGGLVGFSASNTSVLEMSNNTVSTNITSAEEGVSTSVGGVTISAIISTISNAMAQPVQADSLVEMYYVDSPILFNNYQPESEGYSNFITNFNDIRSGFGGLAGGVFGGYQTEETIVWIEPIVAVNNISVNIDAGFGVNTGTLFGYYNYQASTNPDIDIELDIDTITASVRVSSGGTINIDGAYYIGGLFGFLDNATAVTLSEESLTASTGTQIHLQSNRVGMYVGGLVGKMNAQGSGTGSAADNLSITSRDKIVIDTTYSYYMGGLVGQYLASEVQSDSSVQFNGNVATTVGSRHNYIQVTSTEITADRSIQEFGGLIGMIKVTKTDSPVTINVSGTHGYAFTVNTIENSNYYDGASSYDVQEVGSTVYMNAQATYVNLDSFIISPTSDTAWYSDTAKNPLNDNAFGWAKDYTMFKTMQRCIPMSENNGAEWDSIAPIYDASYITYVATVGNLKITTAQLVGTTNEVLDDDYLCFTIYEAEEGSPILYSAIGIATPYYNDNGDYSTGAPNSDTDFDSFGDFLQWAGAILGWSDAPRSHYYFDLSETSNMQALRYLHYNYYYYPHGVSGTRQLKNTNEVFNTIGYTVKNYYRSDETTAHTYFTFQVLYENDSCGGENEPPENGSVFAVTGVNSDDVKNALTTGETSYPWLSMVQTGVTILSFAMPFAWGVGGISGALFKQGFKKGIKAVLKIVRNSAVKGVSVMAVYSFLSNQIYQQSLASNMAQSVYFSVKDDLIGLLGPVYQRDISYSNGKVNTTDSKYVTINGTAYIMHSSERPNDYYEHYYYVEYTDSSMTSQYEIINRQRANDELTITGTDASGAYVGTFNGYNATIWKYYEYQNGMYYVIGTALDVEYTPTQDIFSNPDDFGNSSNYMSWFSRYYVAGQYNSTDDSYSYTPRFDNHMTVSGSDIYVNDIKWDSANTGFNFSETLDRTYFPVTRENAQNEIGDTENQVLPGYGYLQGAYYSASASPMVYADDPEQLVVLYGTYSYYGTSMPEEGTFGIDYIRITYNSRPYYFTLQGNASTSISETETSSDLNGVRLESTPTTGTSVIINMYPYSFTRGSDRAKDNNYYLEQSLVGTTTSGGLSHTATYYYYEGGYKAVGEKENEVAVKMDTESTFSYTDYEGTSNTITVDFTKRYTSSDSEYNTLDRLDLLDSSGYAKVWTVYNSEGVQSTVGFNTFSSYLSQDDSGSTIWYTRSINDINDEIAGLDSEQANQIKASYRLKNNYIIQGNDVYAKESGYIIDIDRDNATGLVCKIELVNTNNRATVDSYNRNKYLANVDLEFYTRYKYEDIDNYGFTINNSTNIRWGTISPYYYLYRNNYISPNFGKTTTLVESVRVIIGGGIPYTTSVTSGTISTPD